MVIGRAAAAQFELAVVLDADLLSANSGMYFASGSVEQQIRPSSTSCMMPIETIGLVIEKMRKMLSRVIGALGAGGLPAERLEPADLAAAGDQHGDAGHGALVDLALERVRHPLQPAWRQSERFRPARRGSGGVCGTVACFAAACAFMRVSRLILSFAGLHKALSRHGGAKLGPEVRA